MEITSLTAAISGTTITVSGIAESGMLAVQIAVYDAAEANVITTYSTAVNSDNTFAATITVSEAGTYVVKAADYDGGEYASVTVGATEETEEETATEETIASPETGFETIARTEPESAAAEANAAVSNSLFVALAVVAAAAVFGIFVFRRRFAKKAK